MMALVSAQWQPYDELPLWDDSGVTEWYRRGIVLSASPTANIRNEKEINK